MLICFFEYVSLRKNYALQSNNGVATQSCVVQDLSPFNGIDGQTASCGYVACNARTCEAEEVWWQVELDQRVYVDHITIYNRDVGSYNNRMEPVFLQLYDGDVLVSSTSLSELWKPVGDGGGTATNDVFTIDFSTLVSATKVKLYKNADTTEPINFRELEAWGYLSVKPTSQPSAHPSTSKANIKAYFTAFYFTALSIYTVL